jgi:hypothetical protein
MIFFSFINICGFIMAALLAGGGFAASPVALVAVSATTSTINVADTTGFLDADILHPAYLQVDDETVYYTSRNATAFTGVVRGQSDPQTEQESTAAIHPINSLVKTLDVDAISAFMGFNVVQGGATFGTFDALTLVYKFFVNIPKYISWDYPWFTGAGVFMRYVLFAFSCGFVLSFAIALVNLGMSLFRP